MVSLAQNCGLYEFDVRKKVQGHQDQKGDRDIKVDVTPFMTGQRENTRSTAAGRQGIFNQQAGGDHYRKSDE
jgi:hypothetical protein